MAFFTGNVYSKSMLIDTQLNVIIPHDGRDYSAKAKPKTLILLHGLSDNASAWYRRTSIDRYAEKHNILVAMPEVQRSYYNNMVYGQNAYTYIAHELPELLKAMFHTSIDRDDMMIAGLSMGGYGAMLAAFKNPDRFGYCGAFSGAYDIQGLMDMPVDTVPVVEGLDKDIQAIFGSEKIIPESITIPYVLRESEKQKIKPRLYMTCGTEDFLYPVNTQIRDVIKELSIDMVYEEWRGIHEWRFWDESVEKMLSLFLESNEY